MAAFRWKRVILSVTTLLLLFVNFSIQQQWNPILQKEDTQEIILTTPGMASPTTEKDIAKIKSTTPGFELWLPTLSDQRKYPYTSLHQVNLILKRPDNLSETAGVDFLLNHCSAFCVNKTEKIVMDPDASCMNVACIPCSCLKPWCHFYDLCCPDIGEQLTQHLAQPNSMMSHANTEPAVNRLAVEDVDLALVKRGHVLSQVCEEGVLLIRDCPSEFKDKEIDRRCRQDSVEPHIKDITRVTDPISGASFYNSFCARCNGLTEVTAWEVTISCSHFQNIYSATDELSFLRLSLRPNSDCSVSQQPPIGISTGPSCLAWWFEGVINSCNVTGLWNTADETLRSLCENTAEEPRYRVSHNFYIFSNLYCFLCNNPPLKKYVDVCKASFEYSVGHSNPTFSSPFSLLLGTSGKNKMPPQTIVDLLENIDVHCSPGKILKNNTCVTAIDKIRGLSYKAFVLYTPIFEGKPLKYINNSPPLMEADDLLYSLAAALSEMFDEYLDDFIVQVSLDLKAGQISFLTDQLQIDKIRFSRSTPLLYFEAKFDTNIEKTRDETENTLVSAFFFKNLSYEWNKFNISFQPIISLSNQNRCFNGTWYPQQLPCTERLLSRALKFAFKTHPDDSELISLDPLITCPFVKFNASDYKYPRDNANLTSAEKVSLNFQGHTVEVYGNWQDMIKIFEDVNRSELRVCYSLLKENVNKILISNVDRVSLFIKFRFHFTQVCIGLSMFCLVLTLFTYLSFRVLRSPAGMNNLFLCFSLLAAQALLLAISHMRPKSPFCTAVGVITHFFWLNMFCWAFVCCFHMFQTFTSKTRSGASTERAKMLSYIKKIAFCTTVPLLIVSTIMITSNLTEEGGSIGYGKIACYLDSQLLAIVGMVVPLSVMVVANIIFFVVTVFKIRSVRKLQGNMDVTPGAPKDIYVYVKLSSLTGCFWILAVAAEYVDNVALKLISDVLIGLQGVFIFWSYVCNERVLNLYRKALGLTVVITSRTGTITRVVRDVEKVREIRK